MRTTLDQGYKIHWIFMKFRQNHVKFGQIHQNLGKIVDSATSKFLNAYEF
jgi:hypothetical protein